MRTYVLLTLSLLASACAHTAVSDSTSGAAASDCAALGTSMSREGIDVSVVGLEVTAPFLVDEDEFQPFSGMAPGTTFAFRVHAPEAMVTVGEPRGLSVQTDRGLVLEDAASFPVLPVENNESRLDALVYARVGSLADAGTTCLVVTGVLPIRLASGLDTLRGRVEVREGAEFVIAGTTFRVTETTFDESEDLATTISLATTDDISGIRRLAFSNGGAPIEMDEVDFEHWDSDDGTSSTTVTYALDTTLRAVDVEASVYTGLRDVEIPLRFGVTVGLGAGR